MFVPSMLLKKLYTIGSLHNANTGSVAFSIKNRLSDAKITGLRGLKINGQAIAPSDIAVHFIDGSVQQAEAITASAPVDFPVRKVVTLAFPHEQLSEGKHEIEIAVNTEPCRPEEPLAPLWSQTRL